MNENSHKVRHILQKGLITEELFTWLEEHNIRYTSVNMIQKPNSYGRKQLVGVDFVFENEIDATAFKIRWIGK